MTKILLNLTALLVAGLVLIVGAAGLAAGWAFDVTSTMHWQVLGETLLGILDGRVTPTLHFGGFLAVSLTIPVVAAGAAILVRAGAGAAAARAGRSVLPRLARPLLAIVQVLIVEPLYLLRSLLPRIERGPTHFEVRGVRPVAPRVRAAADTPTTTAPRSPERPLVLQADPAPSTTAEPPPARTHAADAPPSTVSPAFLSLVAGGGSDARDDPPLVFGMPMPSPSTDDDKRSTDDAFVARLVMQALRQLDYKVIGQIACDGARHGPFEPVLAGGPSLMAAPLVALSSTGVYLIVVRDLGDQEWSVASTGDRWTWSNTQGDTLPCPVTEARWLLERFSAHYGPELARHGLPLAVRVFLAGDERTILSPDLYDSWEAVGIEAVTTDMDDILRSMGAGDTQVPLDLINYLGVESSSVRSRMQETHAA